jgi:hypothetical protein
MLHQITLIVIVWLFFGAAATAAVARAARQRSWLAKPFDVIPAQLGMCAFLANCIVVTILAHSAPQHRDPGNDFFQKQYTSTALYVTALWLTKASILTSYYTLLDGIKPLRLSWYLIVGAIFAGYTCSMLAYPFSPSPCITGSALHSSFGFFVTYGTGYKDFCYSFSETALWISTVWDTLSDIILIGFPLGILLKTDLSIKIKVLAGSRFILIGVALLLSLLRTTVSRSYSGLSKILWLHLLGVVQHSVVSILNDCLAMRSEYQRRLRFLRATPGDGAVTFNLSPVARAPAGPQGISNAGHDGAIIVDRPTYPIVRVSSRPMAEAISSLETITSLGTRMRSDDTDDPAGLVPTENVTSEASDWSSPTMGECSGPRRVFPTSVVTGRMIRGSSSAASVLDGITESTDARFNGGGAVTITAHVPPAEAAVSRFSDWSSSRHSEVPGLFASI